MVNDKTTDKTIDETTDKTTDMTTEKTTGKTEDKTTETEKSTDLPPSLVHRASCEAASRVQVSVHCQLWKIMALIFSAQPKKGQVSKLSTGLKMFENFVKNVLTSGIPVIIMWRKLSYFIPENINESESHFSVIKSAGFL